MFENIVDALNKEIPLSYYKDFKFIVDNSKEDFKKYFEDLSKSLTGDCFAIKFRNMCYYYIPNNTLDTLNESALKDYISAIDYDILECFPKKYHTENLHEFIRELPKDFKGISFDLNDYSEITGFGDFLFRYCNYILYDCVKMRRCTK